MSYIIGVIFIIGFIWNSFTNKQERERQAALEAEKRAKEREQLRAKLLALLRGIETLIGEFSSFIGIGLNSSYFNQHKLNVWRSKSESTYNQLKSLPFEKAELEAKQIKLIQDLISYFEKGESLRQDFNKKFIEHELQTYSNFFDNIEGRKLDNQQRVAVVTDEDNNLVIAGAGSGKTTTIAGKVAYLIHRYKISPDDILLISFTRKASEEMKKRIAQQMGIDIDVFTFHKLGKEIIAQGQGHQPSIFDEGSTRIVIENIVMDLLDDYNYKKKLTLFLVEQLKPELPEDISSKGEEVQFLKNQNIRPFRKTEQVINGRRTLMRDVCKSKEEVKIANFLFLNGVKYQYEAPYQHQTSDMKHRQYKPDFYLPDYDIYIEHWGIDSEGNVPKWFAKSSNYDSVNRTYQEGMDWKRTTHKQFRTSLIETYSHESNNNMLLQNLANKLKSAGVVLKPLTEKEIFDLIKNEYPEDYREFLELIMTFLALFKSNNYTISNIQEKATNYNTKKIERREETFIDIFEEILKRYNKNLVAKGEIDFSDMINQSTVFLKSGKVKRAYKYILIDEFQDISIGRYNLIKAILEQNSGAKIFAVGDDWQSIYRFAGSDIAMFTEFEKYFGVTAMSRIETTYRFNANIIGLSSDFILKNPNQVHKSLKSFHQQKEKSFDILYSDNYKVESLLLIKTIHQIKEHKILNNIISKESEPDVLILGRYNYDIKVIQEDKTNFKVEMTPDNICKVIYNGSPDLKMQFMSVHKAKGLEANYVIVWNCSAGKHGFPSERSDDPLLNLLLTQADQFPNGEERRLFYVALTRCRHRVYLTTNISIPSKFIEELEVSTGTQKNKKCPSCIIGNLLSHSGIKNDRPWTRIYCSNFEYGCEYIDWDN